MYITSQYGTFTITDNTTNFTITNPTGSTIAQIDFIVGADLCGLVLKAAALQSAGAVVNTKIQDMTHSAMTVIHNSLKDDIHVLKTRAESSALGIYHNYVCHTCEDDRALLMYALNSNGMTPGVLAEKTNPTPPVDLFKS